MNGHFHATNLRFFETTPLPYTKNTKNFSILLQKRASERRGSEARICYYNCCEDLLLSGRQHNPVPAISGNQCLGIFRSPASERIIGECYRRSLFPSLQNRPDYTPSYLHLITPHIL